MMFEWAYVESIVTSGIFRAAVLLLVGWPLAALLARVSARAARRRFTPQSGMLAGKAVRYSLVLLVLVMALRELGFDLTALLGAAGIAGVAIGFAAQTSLSNLISGIFLIWEKPFQVGDVVQVDATTGVVHSIDLLSLKIRTFDNRFTRIPNETLIKSPFTNITRFPIRRLDLDINVAYKESIERVRSILGQVADANPFSLDEPAPIIVFKGFGDSALEMMLGVWCEKKDFLALRNSILPEIKRRFDEEGIVIPYPHRTLYTGEITTPFPIRMVPDPVEPPEPGAADPGSPQESGGPPDQPMA